MFGNITCNAWRLLIALALLCLPFQGCTESETEDGDSDLNLNQEAFNTASDSEGMALGTFTIAPGVNAFQVVASPTVGTIRVVSLLGPNGEELIDTSISRMTGATNFQNAPVALNFPILDEHTVVAGNYGVGFETSVPNTEIEFRVISKRDSDLSNGTVRVNVVFVGAVRVSENVRDGIDEAIDNWRDYMNDAGILLDIEEFESSGPDLIPNPVTGDSFYAELSDRLRSGAINVVFGTQVVRPIENDELGIGPGIPGAGIPSPRSAIAIDVREATDSDGEFNGRDEPEDDEVRLLAEALAHHTGHYLGLFHTVDFTGNTVVASDILGSPGCVTEDGCERNDDANDKIMLPEPLDLENDSGFVARDDFTDEQARVMNRSVLLD